MYQETYAVTDPGRTHISRLGVDCNSPATTVLDALQDQLIAVEFHVLYG